MSIQENNALHILHVFGAIGLVASVFFACAGAPETRKKLLRWSGVANLLLVLTGVRMWQGLYQFQGGWVWVKLFCWLALSAFAGIAYRRREKAQLWVVLSLTAALIALVMVYTRPF
jgi:hypothetical protein